MVLVTVSFFYLSTLLFLFGPIDNNFKYLITVIVLDFLTGLFQAYLKKQVNPSISVRGILKKISYFIIVSISVILENILNLGGFLRTIVIYSFILKEMLSILGNCIALGIRLPNIFISVLELFTFKIKEGNELDVKKIKK